MISPIEYIIKDIKEGKMIILMDDEDRENEGDIVMAAEKVTPAAINFMISHCKGLVCLPLSEKLCDYFKLPLMVKKNQSGFGTNFTISIEAKNGISTGISAHDRAKTILAITDPKSTELDIVSPGHIFPLIAQKGGVLARNGHTEAAVDLAKLAGLKEAGVICEIIKEDGSMARYEDLKIFSQKHDLKITTIKKLQEFLRNKIKKQ